MSRDGLMVAIVAFEQPELLANCLSRLKGEYDAVVIDNSLDDVVRAVTLAHRAEYIRPTRNLGFAAAVNRALAISGGRDVLLLNPDARISPNDVERLRSALRQGVAAVAPQLRRPSGDAERTTWPMPTPWLPWAGALGLADRVARVHFLSGAVLLVASAAIKDIGPFDERYFLYAEECDWQKRALERGWQLVEVPEARAEHVGGATSSDPSLRVERFHDSAEAFIRKWYGAPGWACFRAGALIAAGRRSVLARGAAREEARLTLSIYAGRGRRG